MVTLVRTEPPCGRLARQLATLDWWQEFSLLALELLATAAEHEWSDMVRRRNADARPGELCLRKCWDFPYQSGGLMD